MFTFIQIDTPDSNYPPPLDLELIAILLPVLDRVDHNLTQRIFGEPLAQVEQLQSVINANVTGFAATWAAPGLYCQCAI
jgi:hypothetical protein